jgi:hypothetical protein
MSYRELRGKIFDDGVTRYYDPTKHSWVTKEQIEEENRANEIADLIYKIGAAAVIIVTMYGFWAVSVSL